MKKILSIFLAVLVLASCISCGEIETSQGIKTDPDTVATALFDKEDDVQIYFFDTYNTFDENGEYINTKEIDDEKAKELGYNFNAGEDYSATVKPSDCYLIKSGDVEILVDGGYQTHSKKATVQKNVHLNLLRKIASLIDSSGVLDYVIVTHADDDHIASLYVDGGIFDAFYDYEAYASKYGAINPLNDNEFNGFNSIGTIIDFNSGLVRAYSDASIAKNQRLIHTEAYQSYRGKVEKLVTERGVNYFPASALFCNDVLRKDGSEEDVISEENKMIGISNSVAEKVEKLKDNNPKVEPFLNESSRENKTPNSSFKSAVDKIQGGKIVSVKCGDDGERFYYSIPLGKAELRILYNWHYDYIFHSSFNSGVDTSQDNYDSQDANNISVCFEIVKGNFKFLSTGDLGGNGENGIINYYNGTDVLSNVTCYKASHHGSTTNRENLGIFQATKPSILIITGTAATKNVVNDSILNATVSLDKLQVDDKKEVPECIFVNLSKSCPNSFIAITNALEYREPGVCQATPFYGDMYVGFSKNTVFACGNSKSEVECYINNELDCIRTKSSINDDFGIIPLQSTEWFKKQKELKMFKAKGAEENS